MIITKRKLGIAALNIIIAAWAYLCLPSEVAANDATTPTEATEKNRERRQRRTFVSKKDDSERGSDHDRDKNRRHHDPEVFRRFIKAELEHVPGLNNRMERLIKIQAERQELQKQRQAVASKPARDKAGTIERFHSLLRRDFALSDESRRIAQEIVSDLPGIKKQLDTRRSSLETELAAVKADTSTTAAAEYELRRKIRYVEFLDKKLRDLEERPERIDLLTRIVRGAPFDDWRDGRSGDEARTPEDHLADLMNRRQKLQRDLRQVENEIRLIEAKGIKASPDSRE